MDNMENSSYHNDIIKGFDFNREDFKSPAKRNLMIGAEEADYVILPDVKMVESKSLKLYLFSFRNHGDFHEDCVNIIMKDLIKLMDPKYIEVTGIFTPRGGISIYPYCNYGRPGTKYEELAEYRMRNHDL